MKLQLTPPAWPQQVVRPKVTATKALPPFGGKVSQPLTQDTFDKTRFGCVMNHAVGPDLSFLAEHYGSTSNPSAEKYRDNTIQNAMNDLGESYEEAALHFDALHGLTLNNLSGPLVKPGFPVDGVKDMLEQSIEGSNSQGAGVLVYNPKTGQFERFITEKSIAEAPQFHQFAREKLPGATHALGFLRAATMGEVTPENVLPDVVTDASGNIQGGVIINGTHPRLLDPEFVPALNTLISNRLGEEATITPDKDSDGKAFSKLFQGSLREAAYNEGVFQEKEPFNLAQVPDQLVQKVYGQLQHLMHQKDPIVTTQPVKSNNTHHAVGEGSTAKYPVGMNTAALLKTGPEGDERLLSLVSNTGAHSLFDRMANVDPDSKLPEYMVTNTRRFPDHLYRAQKRQGLTWGPEIRALKENLVTIRSSPEGIIQRLSNASFSDFGSMDLLPPAIVEAFVKAGKK